MSTHGRNQEQRKNALDPFYCRLEEKWGSYLLISLNRPPNQSPIELLMDPFFREKLNVHMTMIGLIYFCYL